MPKIKVKLENCKHPNSRKTKSLTKKLYKCEKRDKTRLGHQIKQNYIGEKILWFQARIPDDKNVLTPREVRELVYMYLARFDEELEQIELKNSIGHRKNRHQHASRGDVIKITNEREKNEFESIGLELPDFTDPEQMQLLKEWNGELRLLQNFKLMRLSNKNLLK